MADPRPELQSPHGEDEIVRLRREVARLEDDRARLLGELKIAAALRDSLLATTAQELRTPLQSLVLHVENTLMRVRSTADELPRDWLVARMERTRGLVDRLIQTVHGFLDVSRLQSGPLELVAADVDLVHLVRAAVGRARQDLAWAGCDWHLTAPEPVIGRWDAAKLELLVGNLLSNAIKFGAGKPIELTVSGDERVASLVVRDHGVGIAPEDRRRLFEKYVRGTSPTAMSGFGLGLWVARRIAEAHGGSIAAASEPGQGAELRVTLPRL
jgi:signal transduction histidine kinase